MDTKELIALHLAGKLSHEAQQEFEHLMETDADFRKELGFHSNLKTVISKEEQETTKKALAKYENEFSNSTSFKLKSWMVAASMIILLGFSLFWLNSGNVDNNELFEDYFEPYRNVVQPIVRGDVHTDLKSLAFEAYEGKDYQKALDYFNALLELDNDASILFYKGITQLQLGNTEESINIFSDLQGLPKNLEIQHQWYLALAYLKNNEIDNSKAILQRLDDIDGPYKNEDIDHLLEIMD